MSQWTQHDIKLGYVPRPYQQPHPPIAISAVSPASGSLRYAGTQGFMPVSANFVADWVLETHWPAYAEGAESAGRTADPQDWHVARSIYVAETDAEAERFVNQGGGAYAYYYEYLFKIFDRAKFRGPFVAQRDDDPETLDPETMRQACVIHGSPETVAEKILGLRDRIGDFGTLLYAAHDWQDKDAMKRSMRLMAEEVMAKIRRELKQ